MVAAEVAEGVEAALEVELAAAPHVGAEAPRSAAVVLRVAGPVEAREDWAGVAVRVAALPAAVDLAAVFLPAAEEVAAPEPLAD